MGISEFHESTIVKVRASFGFDGFDCDPDEITHALGIEPAEVRRLGQVRSLRGGREQEVFHNSWYIVSSSQSKDINIHLRELLNRLEGVEEKLEPHFDSPDFHILWKGNYLYAGSGPFYEPDVIQGIARMGGMLYQDIYQIDEDKEC